MSKRHPKCECGVIRTPCKDCGGSYCEECEARCMRCLKEETEAAADAEAAAKVTNSGGR